MKLKMVHKLLRLTKPKHGFISVPLLVVIAGIAGILVGTTAVQRGRFETRGRAESYTIKIIQLGILPEPPDQPTSNKITISGGVCFTSYLTSGAEHWRVWASSDPEGLDVISTVGQGTLYAGSRYPICSSGGDLISGDPANFSITITFPQKLDEDYCPLLYLNYVSDHKGRVPNIKAVSPNNYPGICPPKATPTPTGEPPTSTPTVTSTPEPTNTPGPGTPTPEQCTSDLNGTSINCSEYSEEKGNSFPKGVTILELLYPDPSPRITVGWSRVTGAVRYRLTAVMYDNTDGLKKMWKGWPDDLIQTNTSDETTITTTLPMDQVVGTIESVEVLVVAIMDESQSPTCYCLTDPGSDEISLEVPTPTPVSPSPTPIVTSTPEPTNTPGPGEPTATMSPGCNLEAPEIHQSQREGCYEGKTKFRVWWNCNNENVSTSVKKKDPGPGRTWIEVSTECDEDESYAYSPVNQTVEYKIIVTDNSDSSCQRSAGPIGITSQSCAVSQPTNTPTPAPAQPTATPTRRPTPTLRPTPTTGAAPPTPTPQQAPPPLENADVDGDGAFTARDVDLVQRAYDPLGKTTGPERIVEDIDRNGVVNGRDISVAIWCANNQDECKAALLTPTTSLDTHIRPFRR